MTPMTDTPVEMIAKRLKNSTGAAFWKPEYCEATHKGRSRDANGGRAGGGALVGGGGTGRHRRTRGTMRDHRTARYSTRRVAAHAGWLKRAIAVSTPRRLPPTRASPLLSGSG